MKTLFPLLPRTTSSTLRSYIRNTILSDIKTANLKSHNHKLNRAVQAMLFNMIERGMAGQVQGDKGKARAANLPALDRETDHTEQGMWAVILTKELWKKRVWCVFLPLQSFSISQLHPRSDAKSVSIIAQGCFHPVTKVQSASLHFFLGGDEEEDNSDDEEVRPTT